MRAGKDKERRGGEDAWMLLAAALLLLLGVAIAALVWTLWFAPQQGTAADGAATDEGLAQLPTHAPLIATPTLFATAVVGAPTPLVTATAPPAPTATATMPLPTQTPVPQPSPGLTAADGVAYPLVVDEAQVEAIVAGMTLEQKVAQMLMVGLPQSTMDALALRRVAQDQVGGVIFLEHNTESPTQVAAFTDALQAAAIEASGLPLFIGWNHEGGTVLRRKAEMTAFPSAMALGATGQTTLAHDVGRAMGLEMRSLGVNMSYAPVLDVNSEPANPVIGLRSLGEDPALVAAMGQAFIGGVQSAGVIAVAKHFPGHGAVDVDSHIDLPRLNAPLDLLQTRELPPFQAALGANVGGVMVAHLQIPALAPEGLPSSLAPQVVTELLRGQMGYEGLVMTDDMGMGAITRHYGLEEATVLAVLAGNDVLLAVETQSYPDRMRNAILQAVASGRISTAQIDASVRRIVRLKLAYALANGRYGEVLAGKDQHLQLAAQVGWQGVRVLQDTNGWLPLQLPANRVLLVNPDTMHAGDESGNGLSLLGELLSARGVSVEELFYAPQAAWSVAAAQQSALALAPTVDAVVMVTWNAAMQQRQFGDAAQETMVRALLASGQERGQPVIVVFGLLPYDALRLPEAPAQIATYGDTYGQIDGLAARLLGP